MSRAAFQAQGFASLGRVLDAAALAAAREAADRALAGAPEGPYGRIRHDPWRVEPALERALREGPIGARARALLGVPGVALFQDHIISKPPGTGAEVAWHQDAGYWPLASSRGVTVWVALDDADEGNGCLRYLPGTHLEGERRPADFTAGARRPLRPDLPPLDATGREERAVAAPVRAGAAVAHDPLVWHMSPANPSARPRRAWSITLVLDDARWAPARAPHPFAWALRPTPGAALDPARFPRL